VVAVVEVEVEVVAVVEVALLLDGEESRQA
jgi:hypothetical protein